MKKALLIVLVLVVIAGVVWHYANRQAPAPPAAGLLPDTTLLYVTLPDFAKSREEFKQTQAYALWQEPEVQAFFEKPLREIFSAGQSRSSSVFNAVLQERVLGLLQGEIFLAVTHLSPPPLVRAETVFGADVKQNRLEAQAYLKWMEHDLARQYPGATATDKSYLGQKYTVWQLSQNEQNCHAFLNSLLVFTSDENLMRDVLTRFTGQAPADAQPLGVSGRFQSVQKQMPARHAGFAYFNVEQLLGIAAPFLALSPQSSSMFQQLSSIGASATSVTFDDGLIEDVSLVSYTRNHSPAPAIERRTLALASPDTSLYAVGTADLAGSYRNAMNALAQSGNATLTASAAQFDRALAERGLHLDEVLGTLGPEIALLGIWREGTRLPDVALVAELKNAAQARPQLDAAFDALNDAGAGPSEAQPYLGETLRTWHAGDVISPSYVVTDKFLILTSTADYARALVTQAKNPGPTLAGNADFNKALQRVPAKASSFSYCDLGRVFDALCTLARANTGNNQFVELDRLPKTETLTKHLAPFVSATVDAPEAKTTTTYSSLGTPLTFVVGVAGVLGAAQSWLAQFIPASPITTSSNPPAKSQTAPSQTPPPQ